VQAAAEGACGLQRGQPLRHSTHWATVKHTSATVPRGVTALPRYQLTGTTAHDLLFYDQYT
jgi:hypothetical protein